MKTYTIVKKPAVLDWSQIPAAQIDHCQWGYWADVSAQAQLCYDREAIYVRLSAREAHIRAVEQTQTGMPCEDSCLEFFFCPMADNNAYFNIEMNPNGVMYLGIGTDRYDLIRLLLPENGNLEAETNRTAEGWELTYRIRANLIRRFFPGFEMKPGAKIRGNFYKCGDKTEVPHYFAWNPVECDQPDFHLSRWFGDLYFA